MLTVAQGIGKVIKILSMLNYQQLYNKPTHQAEIYMLHNPILSFLIGIFRQSLRSFFNKQKDIISTNMQPLFPKSQPQVQRGVQKYCELCFIQFSVINREHQCKRCLRAVCSECGKSKCQVWNLSGPTKELHRCCKICKEESEYIGLLIKNNNLEFGKMSKFGLEWNKNISKVEVDGRKVAVKNNLFTKETFSQLWKAYNYELRQLVGILTQKYEEVSIYNMVYNVFSAVISTSPATSLSKIIYLIIFVLCFCSADQAAQVVINLIQLKQHQKDIKTVAFKYVGAMPFTGQYINIQSYAMSRFDRFIDSFLINCCNIECGIFIISQVLKSRNIQDMFMLFATHLYINREKLFRKIDASREMLDQIMLRNCVLLDICGQFKHLQGKRFVDQQYVNLSATESPIRKPTRSLSGGMHNVIKNQLASPTALAKLELVKKQKSQIAQDNNSVQSFQTSELDSPTYHNEENMSMKIQNNESGDKKVEGQPTLLTEQVFHKSNLKVADKQLPKSEERMDTNNKMPDRTPSDKAHDKKSQNQSTKRPSKYPQKESEINSVSKQTTSNTKDQVQILKKMIQKLKYEKEEETMKLQMEITRVTDEKMHYQQKLLKEINNNLKVEEQFANFRTSYQQIDHNENQQRFKNKLSHKQKELDQEKISNIKLKSQLSQKSQEISRLKELVKRVKFQAQSNRKTISISQEEQSMKLMNRIQELEKELQKTKKQKSAAHQEQMMIFIKKNQQLAKEVQILRTQKQTGQNQYKTILDQRNKQIQKQIQTVKEQSFTKHQEQVLTLNIKIKDLTAEIDTVKNNNFIINEQLQQNTRKKQQLFLRIRQLTQELESLRSQNQKQSENRQNFQQYSKNTELKLNEVSSKVVNLEEQLKITKITNDRTKKQNQYQKIALNQAERKITSQQGQIKTLKTTLSQKQLELAHSHQLKEQQNVIKQLKDQIKASEVRYKQMIQKMNDLTKIMIQIQGQKIQLSQYNFKLRDILKKHKINLQK